MSVYETEVNKNKMTESNLDGDDTKEFNKWEDLEHLDSNLLRGIYAYGFDNPSMIQQKSILSFFERKDMIAQAQSGTGKTASFTIGTLSHIDTGCKYTQAIILAPTRELATQITNVIQSISYMMDNIRIKTIIGGTSVLKDLDDIRFNPPHVIVGCPGRVYDIMRRQYIDGKKIKILVIDEADEMLSQGFL